MKKKKELKLYSVEYPLFGSARIDYFIEPNEKLAAEFFYNHGRQKPFPNDTYGFCWNRPNDWPIVWMKNKRADIVSHEMIHAVVWILDGIGVSFSEINEEIFAYMVDYAVNKIIINDSIT